MKKYKEGSVYKLPEDKRAALVISILDGLPGSLELNQARHIAWLAAELVAKWHAEEEEATTPEPEPIPYETNS